MTFLAFEPPPVSHPAVTVCSGSFIVCQLNYASLVSSAISILLTVAFALWVVSRLNSRRPNKVQLLVEFIVGYARGMIRDQVGAEVPAFVLPLALTIFFYILIANWIDIFPIPKPYTPANMDINQTAAMALLVFVLSQAYSVRLRGLGGYLHHFTRPFDLPIWARILFVPLNVIEEIAKPLTLSLRLMGNIFGGVVMLWVLTVLLPAIPIAGIPYVLSVVASAGWKLFDVVFIGAIQAFIFFLLTIIYFGMAAEGVHEDHHEVEHGRQVATTTA